MRCHFNLIDQHEVIVDRKGVEVADFEHALEEALSAIRELREEDPATASDWAGCELKISGASGVLLTSVALDDPALGHRAQPPRPGLASGH